MAQVRVLMQVGNGEPLKVGTFTVTSPENQDQEAADALRELADEFEKPLYANAPYQWGGAAGEQGRKIVTHDPDQPRT